MTLILDWDGTVTVDDTLILALREFGDWQVYLDAAAALRRGEITLHEEIRRDAESITTPIEEVVGWLRENLELRPGFHELAEAYRPLIVSSNFRQLIEPILEREGVELEVRANDVEWNPNGWRATFRNGDSCGPAASRASGPTCRRTARSSTSATATPTAARPRRLIGSSPATPSRITSTSRASPTNRSGICMTSLALSLDSSSAAGSVRLRALD